MFMSVLNGLPAGYETIITAIDAIADEDPSFAFEKVRSRLLQEEKQSSHLNFNETQTGNYALLNLSQTIMGTKN